jgi:hypothetical protein
MGGVVGLVLWIAVSALAPSVSGGWWVMRTAVAPVAALTPAVKPVNKRNPNRQSLGTCDVCELGRLTEADNRMIAQLDDFLTCIRTFTLHVSHQLKTPLMNDCDLRLPTAQWMVQARGGASDVASIPSTPTWVRPQLPAAFEPARAASLSSQVSCA